MNCKYCGAPHEVPYDKTRELKVPVEVWDLLVEARERERRFVITRGVIGFTRLEIFSCDGHRYVVEPAR
jgi:hypothetical protein